MPVTFALQLQAGHHSLSGHGLVGMGQINAKGNRLGPSDMPNLIQILPTPGEDSQWNILSSSRLE